MTPAQLMSLADMHVRFHGGGKSKPRQSDPSELFALAAMPRS